MAFVQTGIRDDVVTDLSDTRSQIRRSKGGKYQKFGAQLLDNVESEFRDDAGSATTITTTGEVRVDVSGSLDDLTFAQVCNLGGARVAEWTPRLTDSIFEHGSVTSGPFTLGETVTGGSSGSTAVVEGVAIGGDFLQVSTISAPFEVGEVITGGGSGASATLTHPTVVAPGDPEISAQRFLVATFKDNTLAVLGSPTAVTFTATIRGAAPTS